MRRRFPAALFALVLIGCTANAPLGDPELPYPPPQAPRVGDVLHLPTGFYVDRQTLLIHASEARVVYVGETHDNPASHQLQLEILKYLQEHNPEGVALAMEMFTPLQQPSLDRWIGGDLSEKEFLEEVGWFESWRMDFAYYRPLLAFARERRIPVIGLNAPSHLVEALGRAPVEELPEEAVAELPDLDFSDPYQQAFVAAIHGGHESGRVRRDAFLRIQTLWDESMAENLATYLRSPGGRGRQVVVVAGGNHVRFGFGIPRRLFRRLPAPYLLVGTKEIEIPEAKRDMLMDVQVPRLPMPPYHFVAFTRYEDLPQSGVKLGVRLREGDGCVAVAAVVPGSAAERAGLRAGDGLCRLDRVAVKKPFDLVYELKQRNPGDQVVLGVERDGEVLEIEVDFPDPEMNRDDE